MDLPIPARANKGNEEYDYEHGKQVVRFVTGSQSPIHHSRKHHPSVIGTYLVFSMETAAWLYCPVRFLVLSVRENAAPDCRRSVRTEILRRQPDGHGSKLNGELSAAFASAPAKTAGTQP